MIKTSKWGMGVAAFAGSLALLSVAASAQSTTTAPPPVTKAPATAPAAKAPATPTAPKAAAPAKAAVVVCKGKDEASCKTEATACAWIVPTKVEANGKVDKAYCRKVAGVAKKAAATAKATTAPVAAPTGAAPVTTPPAKK